MTISMNVEHLSGLPTAYVHCTTSVSRSQKAKYLPAEYYRRFLSEAMSDLKLSPIRALLPFENSPNIVSLVAGKPNEEVFPFKSISFTATSPTDPSKEITKTFTSSALKEILQYGPTDGLPKVKDWIMGLQEHMHKRKPDEGWTVTVGVGSQDVEYKAIKAFVNPGDPVLIESPTYAGTITILSSVRCEYIEVETDSMGLNPEKLRKILENWPEEKPKPKLLYTVPYGGNPAGTTTSTERRREILALAREYNFLIMEDDPYYWLYYGDDERPPSYFQLELELPEVGRVIRFDSFSKILSAGLRFGWASGPKALIDAINIQTSASNLQASSVSQALVHGLVEEWGYDGFETFTRSISDIYRVKRDAFDNALRRYLSGIAEWTKPDSGLYFWVKLVNPNGDGDYDTEELALTKAFQNGVLILPGAFSLPNGRKSAYVRLTFSLLPEEKVHEALKRLRETILGAGGEGEGGQSRHEHGKVNGSFRAM